MMASRRNFDHAPAPFSDAVIGSVLTRSATPGYRVANPNSNTYNPNMSIQYTAPASTFRLPPLRKLSPLAASATELRPMLTTGRLQGDAVPTPPVQAASPYSQPSSTTFQPSDSPARSVSAAVATLSITNPLNSTPKLKKKRRVSVKSEACREQCRTNQARYRQKQREYVSKLEATVSATSRRDPDARSAATTSPLRLAAARLGRCSRLFRRGVGDAFSQGSAHSSDVLRASEAQQQLMFLRSTMAPDVEFSNVSGVEVLMEHWRRLSEYHEDLDFQLTHMEKVSRVSSLLRRY
ncbi:hypothetical protein GQ600_23389 [Phytophthora cactorum]|nr:hypothetical protein GQ600_23389 [Phytophthora cactorum]